VLRIIRLPRQRTLARLRRAEDSQATTFTFGDTREEVEEYAWFGNDV
jgi:hypothetical protein